MDRQKPERHYIFVNPNRDPRAVERALRQLLLEKLSRQPPGEGGAQP